MRNSADVAAASRRSVPLIAFSDGSSGQLSAAAVLHTPAQGEGPLEENIDKEMRCSIYTDTMLWLSARAGHTGLTTGALELAGIALCFHMLANKASELRGGPGWQPGDLADFASSGPGWQPGVLSASVFSYERALVDFATEAGGASKAGARHLEGLAAHVRGLWEALRSDPAFHHVHLSWAPRGSGQLHRVGELALTGENSDWPDGLRQLLSESSEEYLAASPEDQMVMLRY